MYPIKKYCIHIFWPILKVLPALFLLHGLVSVSFNCPFRISRAFAQTELQTLWVTKTQSPASTLGLVHSNYSHLQSDEMMLRSVQLPQTEFKGDLSIYDPNGKFFRFWKLGVTAGIRKIWRATQPKNTLPLSSQKNTSLLDPAIWITPQEPFQWRSHFFSAKGYIQFPFNPHSRNQYYRLRTGLLLQSAAYLGKAPETESGPGAFYLYLSSGIQHRLQAYRQVGSPWYFEFQPKAEWRTSGGIISAIGMTYRRLLKNQNIPGYKELDASFSLQTQWTSQWSTHLILSSLLETESGAVHPLQQNWVTLNLEYRP